MKIGIEAVKFLILFGSSLLVWIIATIAMVQLDGPRNWAPSIAGWLLCVIPAMGTLAGILWMERRSGLHATGAAFMAPILRIFFVLIFGTMACLAIPALNSDIPRFVFWVLGFYLWTLIVETILILPRHRL